MSPPPGPAEDLPHHPRYGTWPGSWPRDACGRMRRSSAEEGLKPPSGCRRSRSGVLKNCPSTATRGPKSASSSLSTSVLGRSCSTSCHKANHPDLTYREGQRPIVHLEADLHEVVTWADGQGQPWAFTDRNAGSHYFHSFRDIAQLDQLNWDHIANRDFRDTRGQGRQAGRIPGLRGVPLDAGPRRIGVIEREARRAGTRNRVHQRPPA